ncbi:MULTISPECIES: MoxR family ATPase [unclassified Streptomyces]|uniref:AAA family ATPase n=1 Tax=unclassified Streptomyces TaxID=2593676 RepID=UPI0003A78E40|nr:MoxR family ATPase [Streptomyces sp. BoleA5]MYX38338.1 AAA domain-containing protein [Streptomyces sp. SID8377]
MTRPDDDAVPVAGQNDGQPPRWWIYRGAGQPLQDTRLADLLPPPPPWRSFGGGPVLPPPPDDDAEIRRRLGLHRAPARQFANFAEHEANMVNAALLLRRPLLVSGRPGTGKSSLAYRISRELRLGRVLRWHITSRTTLQQGLYEYDAIGRVQDTAAQRAAEGEGHSGGDRSAPPGVGDYIQLGPVGTALLPYAEPRVLLIDELDKSDLDLANDLLSVFEEGSYSIPELLRARRRHPRVKVLTDDPDREAEIIGGTVTCSAFPLVILTSNSEREFPPAFLRRCLLLDMPEPDENDLADMLVAHFGGEAVTEWADDLISRFLERSRQRGGLSNDQLLNSLYLAMSARASDETGPLPEFSRTVWHGLNGTDPGARTA